MGRFFTEKRKKEITIYLILWLIFAIVLVVPTATAIVDATDKVGFNANVFLNNIFEYLLSIEARVKAFQHSYFATTSHVLKVYTVIYIIFAIILMLKSKKGDYHDIEHGSSDWSVGGEQYKVLSKNSGIILAEKNYLPIDKKGNVNVLIVGRIWCW